ncbi:uncharacterized protein N7483_004377 [Penicillium malachiteum]|uniref:uncharacterized protein n=1 Tax=Penicillium malachiteum TaxID=1324776 RepID=UPI002548F2F3|nr:uncharacterized protein N7483_004377 [Penicillium malachiteum]KAJ5729869.1 hypothetical protein N7483_004377 [Penicillium malachiteum]
MQHYSRSDFLEAGSLSRSRSTSLSSDSQHPRLSLMSPPSVSPAPAFISPSAASEIITSDQEFNAADFVAEEDTGATADVLVTPAALSLLNGFLDNLLFNILAASKSTQLSCIRPILADVLKPRLAQEVVATADEELCEYMGGEDDEKTEFRGGQEPGGEFDLVHSWKLTRLRCMVYTRLGDMEEEDEDEFIAQDRLGEADGAPRRFSSHVDNITPAAAIFLTSIMEHIGERALVIAGETARSRLSSKLNDTDSHLSDDFEDHRKRIERLIVEDLDMEKLALNATLGRLWRTWRKRRRGTTLARTLSRESFRRRTYTMGNSRRSSIATIEEPVTPREPLTEEKLPLLDPATVPLPLGDHDVEEIEVPGYNPELDGEVVQTMQAIVAHKVRPRSLMVVPSPSLVARSGNSPLSASAVDNPMLLHHARSRSLPNQKTLTPREPRSQTETDRAVDDAAEEVSPGQSSPNSSKTSRSSSREKQLETMYEDDESAEFVDAAETATGIATAAEKEEDGEIAAEEKERMSIVQEEEEEEEDKSVQTVSLSIASLRSRLRDDESMDDSNNSSNRVSIASTIISEGSAKDPEVIEGRGMCEKPTLTSAIQRPKRKSSRDVSGSYAKPIIAETSDADAHPVVTIPQSTQGAEPALAPPADATIEAITPVSDNGILDCNQDSDISGLTPVSEIAPSCDDLDFKTPVENLDISSVSAVPHDAVFFPGADPSAAEFAAVADYPSSYEPSLNPEPEASTLDPVFAAESPRPASTSGDSERSVQPRTRHRPTPLVVTASNRTSPSLEQRAAVQRMPTRPSTSISSSAQAKSRRSESFSSARDKRPVTAGSTTSSQVSNKLKGLMIRPAGESPTLRLRSSSETSRASGSGESLNDTTDLDKLINSDETIHFTLTPRSVREMTFPDLPRPIPRSDTTNTSDLAQFLKNTGPPGADPRASVSSKAAAAEAGRADSPKHIPISSRMTLSPNSAAGQSRELRPGNSTLESAEVTSVPSQVAPPPIDSPKSPKSPKSPARSSMSSTASRNPNRPKLQARAAETRGSETSDLIDFIRQGPPEYGAHRIPRTVAPFRNTIDSDDLPFDSPQDGSLNSNRGDSAPNKSLTSIGSRTGLLNSATRPGQAKATASNSRAMDEDPHPVRKQRRVRDPYAIDDSDDDDLLEEMISNAKPPRQEESLLDFLRSEPPPDFDSKPKPLSFRQPPLVKFKWPGPSITHAQSNYSFKVGMERNPGIIPSTSNRQTETSALADFLRNTGPPEPAPQSPAANKSKEGGFARFFNRRKKIEA